jgi:hypothetical protein
VLQRVYPYLSSMQNNYAIFFCGHSDSPYFSTLLYKRQDFRKNKFTEDKNVFRVSLQNLFEIFYILKIIQHDIVKISKRLYLECPLFLSEFRET